MYKYLHGCCDYFAEALSQVFGYEVDSLRNNRGLIHAYCIFCENEITYYIDARGITDDYEEFIQEFSEELNESCILKKSNSSKEFLQLLYSVDKKWVAFLSTEELTDLEITYELDNLFKDNVFRSEYNVKRNLIKCKRKEKIKNVYLQKHK